MTHILRCLVCLILFAGCANQSQPTGGPKDEIPPRLIQSTPEAGQRNYTGQIFEFIFDEDINLKSVQSQLLITPRTLVEYEIKYKRNVVTMEFDSLLDANTTYTFSFREGIVDLTEGNPAEDLQIAFSTGSELDTLQLEGIVHNAFTNEKVAGSTVVLYKLTDTTNVFNGPPYYFTQTTDSGAFLLSYLKAGAYKIYALNDYNNNLKGETDSEPYAFLADTINIGQINTPIELRMASLNLDSLKIFSARKSGSTFAIKFNKPLVSYELISEDSIYAYLDYEDPSLVRLQTGELTNVSDSTLISIIGQDSLDFNLTEQFYVNFEPTSSRKQPFDASIYDRPIIVRKPELFYRLEFTKPAFIYNSDSIFIQIDSVTRFVLDSSHYQWNTNHTRLDIRYSLNKNLFVTQDTVPIDKTKPASTPPRPFFKYARTAFVSLEYDTIKGKRVDLEFLSRQDVSSFVLTLSNTPNYPIIVEFIDSDSQVYSRRTFTQDGTYTFNDIPPGTYTIRVIHDSNSNDKWDPGNFYKLQQPELIQYVEDLSGSIKWQLRANFDFEQSLQLLGE